MPSLAKIARRWGLVWAVGGLIAGLGLAVTDSGHVPAFLAPLIVALAGAVGGLLGGLLFYGLRRAVPSRRSTAGLLVLGAAAGALAGGALYLAGLGVILPYCLAAGALLGAVSALR